jgi:hypothetical protein
MAGIDWFRWHHGSVTDPKFQLVARKSGASLSDVLAVWAYVLEIASAAELRGCVGDIDTEAWDCLFGFPAAETRTADILAAMEGRKLLGGGLVVNWEKRQPKRERIDNTSADRQATFKAKAKQVTPSNAKENQVTPDNTKKHLEERRVEESREEEKDTHSSYLAPVEPNESPGVSRKTAICMVLKAEGIGSVNPQHPELLNLVDQGAEVGLFAAAAVSARSKGKGFAYVLGIVKGQLADAANLARASPSAGSSPKAAESFKERDARLGRKRWEEMTGEEHPENRAQRLAGQVARLADGGPMVMDEPRFLERVK